jgi:hypothetical protein
LRPSRSTHHSLEKHIRAQFLSHMLKVSLRNLNVLETSSMSGLFSRLRKHCVEHWWKLDLLQKPNRWSSVFTTFHVSVADITLAYTTQCSSEKSNLAHHAYEEDHNICYTEAKVLQTEPISTYRKCKEAAHMVLAGHLISQPSFYISSIWISIIEQKSVNYNSGQSRLQWELFF